MQRSTSKPATRAVSSGFETHAPGTTHSAAASASTALAAVSSCASRG
jgi:hypothetical protein